jgi:hypothetical protein
VEILIRELLLREDRDASVDLGKGRGGLCLLALEVRQARFVAIGRGVGEGRFICLSWRSSLRLTAMASVISAFRFCSCWVMTAVRRSGSRPICAISSMTNCSTSAAGSEGDGHLSQPSFIARLQM